MSSGGVFLFLFFLCCGIFMTAAVYLVYNKKITGDSFTTTPKIPEITPKEVTKKVRDVAEESGHDPDVLEKELKKQTEQQIGIEKGKKTSCMVNPSSIGGKCSTGYTLEEDDGCCYPDASTPPNPNAAKVQAVKDLSVSLIGGSIVETVLTAGLKKSATLAKGAKGAANAAKVAKAAKAAKAAKSAASTGKLAIAAIRTGVKVGKGAASMGKFAVAAAGGPAGLAVAVAMLLFDGISMVLDAKDTSGYQSSTTNGTLNKFKDVIDYETAKSLSKLDLEYPMIFPIGDVYPTEFEAALEYSVQQISSIHMAEELEKDEALVDIVAAYGDAVEIDPDAELPTEFLDFINGLPSTFHIERDKFLLQKLQELIGPKSDTVQFYEELSTPDTMAVTLSEKGVKEWNDKHKETWYAYNDLFKPPDPPPTDEPMTALYTDKYYVYESGPSDNPKMVERKLKIKVALGSYYGSLVAYCEKSRKLKETSATIRPLDLGVSFQYDTGVCKFTREYCSRYGLEFSNNDCKTRPGQGFAELIFGESMTREFIRAFTSPPPYPKKSKGPAKKGPCPPGMRDDGMNCWLDPVKRDSGSPMECRPDKEKKGQLCYPRCRDGYESKALECEGTCPSGSKNTGLTCLQSIHAYIPKPTIKYIETEKKCKFGVCVPGVKLPRPGLEDCRDGYTYRGTTCNQPCMDGFTFRSGAAGSAFCDKPRNRYSRAANSSFLETCPDNKEKQGLLCYNKCSNKGDNGVYKYNGVLDWCQPQGGAGIKKGLDARWICPEGTKNVGGICYENCKPGESEKGAIWSPVTMVAGAAGLLCNPN